jgi:UDP-glucose 4-epimerase
MKILFTGSSGPKVASTVATRLSQQHNVVGIDLCPLPHANAQFTTHVADIREVADWRPMLEGVEAVVHFAALHAPHRETHSRDDFRATNVEATHRLLEAARLSGVSRFLLASTTSVYGKSMRRKDRAAWVTEDLVPEPEDIYDETKLAAEAICRDAFASNFATMALRFSRSFPEPLPLMAMYRLYRGVDGRDVAQAFGRALTVSVDEFHALNVSGATSFHESDAEALMFDAPTVIRHRCPEIADEFARRGWALPASIDRVYVIDRAKQHLGFCPEYSWQQVLDK